MRYQVIAAFIIVGALWRAAVSATDAPPAAPATAPAVGTIAQTYPGLVSGALTDARLADLPEGTILKSGEVVIVEADLASVAAAAPVKVREQLSKNAVFVLERLAAPKLLLAFARQDASRAGRDIAKSSDQQVVDAFLKATLDSIAVSDAEVAAFYNENKSMFGGASLDAVKGDLGQYLRQQKQQEALRALIESLGQKMPIEVSAPWAKAQSLLARDNPVDKARLSGKPTMVDFGRDGCGPCDMMTPILKTLATKYMDKANVLFVHTGEEEILAMRYGIDGIPTQIFFDRDGKETFRHTGFFAQDAIEKKLAEMGVK